MTWHATWQFNDQPTTVRPSVNGSGQRWLTTVNGGGPPPDHRSTVVDSQSTGGVRSGMDKSKITRKQSKVSKHGHENQKSTKPKPQKPIALANLSSTRAILAIPNYNKLQINRIIKSQTITLTPNQILTKELIPDIKQWEELIRENVFGLGGHREHLPTCLAHMLYYVVAEEQYNLAYFFIKRIECARANPTANLPYAMFLTRLYRHIMEVYPHLDNDIYDIVDRVMRPLALKQTRRPRSDRGKARHSVSSSRHVISST
ncbi:hypothetical protein Tco_1359558 [Tanacetum coccineum]